MKTLLLSWIAWNQDFLFPTGEDDPTEVRPDGPSLSLHEYFFDAARHERHLILTTAPPEPENRRVKLLRTALKKAYPKRKIDFHHIGAGDPTDVNELVVHTKHLLNELAKQPMEAFISPGTPSMQVAWYLHYFTNQYELRLYKGTEAKHSPLERPEFEEVRIEASAIPKVLVAASKPEAVKVKGSDSAAPFLSGPNQETYAHAQLVAEASSVPVLITGESGTGKEHLAHFIARQSNRSKKPCLTLNCAAFRDELLESRLFGYKKGAFTGADKDTPGLFEQADGGMLFLDEIGEISPYMQQALLRVTQSGEIQAVGSLETRRVDVRLICATNRDLLEECKAGRFRWDLYYRLVVAELNLQPLRHWPAGDKRQLISFLVSQTAQRMTLPELRLTEDAMSHLLRYTFPGNIRELDNLIRSLYIYHNQGEQVGLAGFPKRFERQLQAGADLRLQSTITQHCRMVLEDICEGNKSEAARLLDIAVNTLKKHVEQT